MLHFRVSAYFFFVYCVVFLMCLRASASIDDMSDRKIPTVSEDRYLILSARNATTCNISGVLLMYLRVSVMKTLMIGRVR